MNTPSAENLISVLHIDDDNNFLNFVKIYIEEKYNNLDVDSLSNPEEVFQKLEEKEYDVIVSDYQMPDLDGLELLEELRKRGNEIAFIIFTGKGREEVAIRALNLGADYYLQKGEPNVSFAELNHFINVATRKKREYEHRLRIEQALKESEEKYRIVVDNAYEGILVAQDGMIKFFNPETLKIIGYSDDELFSKPFIEFIHPEDRDLVLERHVKRLKNENDRDLPSVYEFRIVHKSGKVKWVEINIILIKWEGRPATLNFLNDITERKKTERALQESESKSRSIIDSLPMGMHMYKLEPDGNLIFTGANPAADGILGIDHKQFVGKTIEEAFPSSIGTEIPEKYRLAAAEGKLWKTDQVIYEDDKVAGAFDVHAFQTSPNNMVASFLEITDRKKAELALQESENNLRTFFNTLDEFLFVLDERGVILRINGTVVDRLGYSEEELVGQAVLKVHPPERREEVKIIIKKMLDGKIKTCPIPLITKKGDYIPVETRVAKGIWSGREVLFCVSKDISELEASEEKFSKAFYTSPILMAISTLENGKIVDVNDNFLEILGYRKEEVIDKTSSELDIFVDYEQRNAVIQEILEKGRARNVEIPIRTKNGNIRHGIFSADIIQLQEKKYLLTTMKDITERKEAEEALRKERDIIKKYLDVTGVMIVAINAQQQVTLINKKGCEILGCTEDDIINENWFDNFLPKNIRENVKNVFDQLIAGDIEPVKYYENPVITRGGEERIIAWYNTILRDENQSIIGTLSSGEDITERKRAEEALKRSEENLRWESDLLRRITEASPVGITIVDQDGKIAFANTRAEKVLGLTKDKITNRTYNDPEWHITDYNGDPFPDSELPFVQVMSTGQPVYDVHHAIEWLDGRLVLLSINASPLFDESDQLSGMVATVEDVTTRVQAEEQLKYQANLLTNISDAVISTDMNFIIKSWNKAAESIYGWREIEVLGKGIPEVTQIEYPYDDSEEIITQFLKEGIWRGEVIQRKKDGGKVNILASVSMIRDREGVPMGVVAINRDITERKRVEEELRTNQKRLEMAIEASGAGIYDHAVPLDQYAYHSERWAEILGYALEELPKPDRFMQWLSEQVHPGDIALLEKSYSEFISNPGIKYDVEVRMKHKSGNWIHVHGLSKATKRDDNGYAKHIVGVMLDITERKLAEEKLQQTWEWFRVTLRSIGDAVITTNREGHITFMNREAERLTGWSFNEVAGQDLLEVFKVIDEVTGEPIENPIEKILREGLTNTIILISRDGRRVPIADSGSPIRDDKGNVIGTVLVFQDITEEMMTRENETFLNELLRHDVRNKNLIVKGYLSFLDENEITPQQQEFINKAIRAIQSSIDLIEKIRSIRKAGMLEDIQDIDLDNLLKDAIRSYTDQASEKGMVIDYISVRILVVAGYLLKELFDNLIENAIRHSVGKKINITVEEKEEHVIVSVEDDGKGFPERIKDRIFERGVKGPGSPGSGLGLYLTTLILEKYGGTIKAMDSALGGARIDVRLKKV
ncbi:MAG: PAS domain S-box protein [Candidatus Hodarchaeales archaeon]|jgi:PAS domain S-box-containing protein